MPTIKFWTQIDPTKTLPLDDASQAHLVALAADVVRAIDATRDPVEIEVDAMFDTETHARMTAAYRGEL